MRLRLHPGQESQDGAAENGGCPATLLPLGGEGTPWSVPSTPAAAASDLERKIEVLRKRLEVRRGALRGGAARPAPAGGAAHQPAVAPPPLPAGAVRSESSVPVAHAGMEASGPVARVGQAVTSPVAAHDHLLGAAGKAVEAGASGAAWDEGRPAVGERRRRSPSSEVGEANRPPPLLELRRRSPMAETLSSDATLRGNPAHLAAPSAHERAGTEAVVDARLRLGILGRSSPADAEQEIIDSCHAPADRRQTPCAAAAGLGVPANGIHYSTLLGPAGASLDIQILEAVFGRSTLTAESVKRAREAAESRLRGVRRLIEENLREDLELQVFFSVI